MTKMDYEKILKSALQSKETPFEVASWIEEQFPELAKSESEDENIRRELIKGISKTRPNTLFLDTYITREEALAWLEKQGEKEKFIKKELDCIRGYREEAMRRLQELEKQGESTEINPSEFDSQLNRLLKQFKSLPKEDLASSLSFYLNVVQNDGTYKDEKQGEQKIPKFRVGDTIEYNGLGHNRYTIKDVCGTSHYINTNNARMDMSYTDANFELVGQKSADNVKPKFKVGDWVIDKQGIVHQIANVIKNVTNNTYGYDVVGGGYFNDNTEGVRLWTIQDAKDGDVVVDDNLPFIFKKIDANKYSYAYCGISLNNDFKIKSDGKSGEWTWTQDIKPATKEQREQLEKAMAEAGYEWDADKRELKKIEQKHWSEEDEEIHRKCICAMRASACGFPEEEKFVEQVDNWLKSLKDRVQIQPKQEWSEEDESHIRYLIECLEHCKKGVSLTMTTPTAQEYIDWLKSLRPQSQWKPSEEMLEALYRTIPVDVMEISEDEILLDKLYQGLKYGRV